ncbi:unnamed protein product [Adineta ricciae]|uniref:Uncharacterized protein n=1 Tax=Adineta ricciae TaxID=249248 RepID=A0A815IJ39_ADIRI|nr:unnamed protein product [Adineta ricciae]CAF1674134.1 unnamed protein product [Adineta ricciae]
MDGNSKIINVPVDECAIVTDVLATTGVDSCLVVAAIFDSTSSIFIGHYSTAEIEGFGELITLDNVQQFMETIVEQICENVSLDSLKTVFLIGGWNTKPYLELQELVENIRNDEKHRCSENDDDIKDNWICQFDLIVDRVAIPPIFLILQYANLEMNDHEKKLVIIFHFDGNKGELKNVLYASSESNQPAFINDVIAMSHSRAKVANIQPEPIQNDMLKCMEELKLRIH